MKRILLTLTALFVSTLTFTQTNTFPTTGNAGIGTTSPKDKLQIGSTLGLTFHDGGHKAMSWNSYYSAGSWKYIGADFATQLYMDYGSNTFKFNVTPTGTADGTITWTNAMTLKDNGFVGIGATSPNSKLHILNDVNNSASLNLDGNLIEVNGGGVSKYQDISFTASGTAGNAAIRHYANAWQNSRSELAFLVNDNTGLYEALRINNEGRIGIGTTSPGSQLDVIGEIRSAARITSNSTSSQMPQLYLRNSGSLMSGQKFGYIFSNMDGIMLQANTTGIDANTANGHMVIRSSGNVGIGTASPSEKLEVNGTVRSKKVKVEATGWPDYVFSESYKLRTLNELEQYIHATNTYPKYLLLQQ